ncbi:cyclic nucleotide-binding domain-containing protein [Myxococcota bacterium]|nr:cyclic nucleotide-binding domain-containing protein [Myxococcota bacterium]
MALDPRELSFIRILRGLEPEQIMSFLGACRSAEVPADTVIMEEGEVDRSMLFILDGELEVYIGSPPAVVTLRRAGRGEHLGELAALGLVTRRSASVRTLVDTDLLVLDEAGLAHLRGVGHPVADRIEGEVLHALSAQLRETDRQIAALAVGETLEPEPDGMWHRMIRSLGHGRPLGRPPKALQVLKSSPHFIGLTNQLMERLASELEPVAFAEGDRILEEGSIKGDAWIVAAGRVGAWRQTAMDKHEKLATLQPGALFGHVSIMDGDLRTATCIAETPAWLYRVPRELCETLVDNATPEGRALRRCLIDASVQQLMTANQRLDQVAREHAARKRPDLFTPADLEQVRRED